MVKNITFVTLLLLLPAGLGARQVIAIRVHASESEGSFNPVWAYSGHDEPNYTYSPEGRELLSQLAESSPTAFHDRTHFLLTTGDGTPSLKWGSTNVYSEDASGKPIYNWTILDRIFDTYQATGITPYVEIGFMPEALSTHPQPYEPHWPKPPYFTGWSYPPKDYQKWSALITEWVRHSIERYGRSAVEKWDWEVWNEPNIGYWHGTLDDYCKLYDYTAATVKRALPEAHVGGPASTGPASPRAAEFLRGFLQHCVSGRNYATGIAGSSIDFISFHAKGRTAFVDGHVRMDVRHNLQDIAHGFEIISSFPQLRALPIVISESDPEGCAACAASIHAENEYRNTSQYASYEAELLDGTLSLAWRDRVNLQGAITWAFTFPGQPYFYGYRSFATRGIDKPVINAFRLFGLMGKQRVQAQSSGQMSLNMLLQTSARTHPDAGVIATRESHEVAILVWNYDDEAIASPPARINLDIDGLPQEARRILVTHYRVDRDHSNSDTVWKQMGSPQNPTLAQVSQLKSAGQLQLFTSPEWARVEGGKLNLSFDLPRQALSLIRLSW